MNAHVQPETFMSDLVPEQRIQFSELYPLTPASPSRDTCRQLVALTGQTWTTTDRWVTSE